MALQWNTKVKYMTSMPLSYAIGATILKDTIETKISADDQKLISKITKGMQKTLRKTIRKDNESAKKQMERKGVKISDSPAEMIAAFDSAADAVWKELTGKMYSKAELDLVLKHRADYRAKNPPKAP